MPKPVQNCLEILRSAQKDINAELKGTEYVHQLLEVNSAFKRLETRFLHMGAVTEPENFKAESIQFPPITSFMGEKIELPKKIDRSELTPKEADKQKFREDVKKLYDQIIGKDPQAILNAYTIPDHILIVRGVAKLAGVEDYDTKEINPDFIVEIQIAIEEKAATQTKQENIDKAAGKKQK